MLINTSLIGRFGLVGQLHLEIFSFICCGFCFLVGQFQFNIGKFSVLLLVVFNDLFFSYNNISADTNDDCNCKLKIENLPGRLSISLG